ncbi:hypothetical protein V2J09_003046 [Rumex salicifolius]
MKQKKKVGLPHNRDEQKLMSEAQHMLRGITRHDQRRVQRKLQIEDSHHTSQQNRVITRDQFLSWAVVAYKNCWGLKRTLCSSKRVFIKLNRILSTFLLTLMLIVWLLLSKIVDSGQLALLFTPFLAALFIFGDTCRKMFDVGDRSSLNTTSVILTSTKIINLDITPDQADSLDFTIPSSTPLEDITDLEIILTALDDDITYSSQTKVAKKEITKEDIKMAVYFKYLVSYLGAETKAMHRSRILTKIMEFSKEMEINVHKASSAFEDSTCESYKEHSSVLMKGLEDKSEESKDSKEAVERLKQHIMLEIKTLNGQVKDLEAWSRRLLEVCLP